MSGPHERKAPGELASNTGRKLIAAAHYATLTLLAKAFGTAFWLFEQRRWRLVDQLENERSAE